MSKVEYYWKMHPEEALRLASSCSLSVPDSLLYDLLVAMWKEGWDEGWDAKEVEERRNEREIKFNELV